MSCVSNTIYCRDRDEMLSGEAPVKGNKREVKNSAEMSCSSLLTARSAVSLVPFAPPADGLGHICA